MKWPGAFTSDKVVEVKGQQRLQTLQPKALAVSELDVCGGHKDISGAPSEMPQ